MSIVCSAMIHRGIIIKIYSTDNFAAKMVDNIKNRLINLANGPHTYTESQYTIEINKLDDISIISVGKNQVKLRIIHNLSTELLNCGLKLTEKNIQERIEYYNDPKNDKINSLNGEIEEAKMIMSNNVEKILENSEKLSGLVDKSSTLVELSASYHNSAKQLRRKLWCKNMKLTFIVALVVCLVIFVIVALICFPKGSICRKAS